VLADAGASPGRILDVGCGSGILAIAAVKRWPAATCIAIDNDPIAVQATAENALHNKVEGKIDASVTPLGDLTETFPLVLANIQAHVLRELKAPLIARTRGTLILSGLLTPQAQPLADEFVAAGMKLVSVRASTDDPQWSSVVLES
jgi:ribosomal protein L11 methyltransferase